MSRPFPTTDPFDGSESTSAALSATSPRSLLVQAMLEGFVDGVMVVSLEGEILQANRLARQICQRLQPHAVDGPPRPAPPLHRVPASLWLICRALIDHHQDDAEPLMPEQDVILGEELVLRVRVQWTTIAPGFSQPPRRYLLITVEDRYQALRQRAIADMQRYGLTRREAQVWLLRLRGLEYRAIAQNLHISENTVKKHLKSVFAKKRSS